MGEYIANAKSFADRMELKFHFSIGHKWDEEVDYNGSDKLTYEHLLDMNFFSMDIQIGHNRFDKFLDRSLDEREYALKSGSTTRILLTAWTNSKSTPKDFLDLGETEMFH